MWFEQFLVLLRLVIDIVLLVYRVVRLLLGS